MNSGDHLGCRRFPSVHSRDVAPDHGVAMIAHQCTGLSKDTAGFQVRSALSGADYTTSAKRHLGRRSAAGDPSSRAGASFASTVQTRSWPTLASFAPARRTPSSPQIQRFCHAILEGMHLTRRSIPWTVSEQPSPLSASCRNFGTDPGIEGAKTISNKIFVGNLNFATTDQELRELFNEVGEVVDVYIPTDRETGRPRGFAFVRFASEEQAAKAVEEVHGREVGGRPLRLDIAEDRRRSPRPQPQRDYNEMPPEPRSFDKFDKFDKSKKSKGSRRGLRARKRSL